MSFYLFLFMLGYSSLLLEVAVCLQNNYDYENNLDYPTETTAEKAWSLETAETITIPVTTSTSTSTQRSTTTTSPDTEGTTTDGQTREISEYTSTNSIISSIAPEDNTIETTVVTEATFVTKETNPSTESTNVTLKTTEYTTVSTEETTEHPKTTTMTTEIHPSNMTTEILPTNITEIHSTNMTTEIQPTNMTTEIHPTNMTTEILPTNMTTEIHPTNRTTKPTRKPFHPQPSKHRRHFDPLSFVGGTILGFGVAMLIALLIYFCFRRRQAGYMSI